LGEVSTVKTKLDREDLATIREALLFSLAMSDAYYSLAPKGDYNDGWKGLQGEREKRARKLFESLQNAREGEWG
jgi:hypothetical protein